ncbi:hypothetical protein EMGBD3_10380 [Nitrosarchaeum sp.]|nr:hypothetical protein EMGBD3_10380 [Nitrosarchaeum sp.]
MTYGTSSYVLCLFFQGFWILGVFGHDYQIANIEASEFGKCYQYYNDKEPVAIDCSSKLFDQALFFIIVIVLIMSGIISLIKGIKGKWDNEVKTKDMVGPGGDKNLEKD